MTGALLVEFCGLPGAGKSTLCEAVLATLEAAGVRPRDGTGGIRADVPLGPRIRRKLALAGGAVRRDPAGTVASAACVLAASGGGPRDAVGRVLQWTGTQQLCARARAGDGLHLLDEGVVQALWSVGLRSDPAALLDGLARAPGRWLRPDVVVLVDEPVDVAVERLRRRASHHSRTQHLSGAAQVVEMQAGQRLLERLLDWLMAVPAPPELLRVRPTRGAERARLEVSERLLQLSGASSRS